MTAAGHGGSGKGRVRIYQIYYDAKTRAMLDPAFIPLDNLANERPDWAEYWPIRRLLASESFDGVDLLGIFSPRFRDKTGLTGKQVMAQLGARADVYSFSPYFEQSALYQSPIEQGDAHHPGLRAAMAALLPHLGLSLDLDNLVTDRSTTIFANYFVAPVSLWREWFAMAETIFALCEAGDGGLADALNATTRHRGPGYPLKVFVMERLITLLLETRGIAATPCLDPRSAPRSLPDTDLVLDPLLVCDQLKSAYRRTGEIVHRVRFLELRGSIVAILNAFEAERRSALAAAADAAARLAARRRRRAASPGYARKTASSVGPLPGRPQ